MLSYNCCCWHLLQLTKIDGQFFLEMMSDSVVFVNDVRVQFKMLTNGARITLGGVNKSYQQGCRFPTPDLAKPHLVYEYRVAKDQSLTGIYKDPVFSSADLIKVDESVYHMEDFNMTLVHPQILSRCFSYSLIMDITHSLSSIIRD